MFYLNVYSFVLTMVTVIEDSDFSFPYAYHMICRSATH